MKYYISCLGAPARARIVHSLGMRRDGMPPCFPAPAFRVLASLRRSLQTQTWRCRGPHAWLLAVNLLMSAIISLISCIFNRSPSLYTSATARHCGTKVPSTCGGGPELSGQSSLQLLSTDCSDTGPVCHGSAQARSRGSERSKLVGLTWPDTRHPSDFLALLAALSELLHPVDSYEGQLGIAPWPRVPASRAAASLAAECSNPGSRHAPRLGTEQQRFSGLPEQPQRWRWLGGY